MLNLKDTKDGITKVFVGKAAEENLFCLDGRTPLKKAIPFGIQHVLAMFMANITPLIIVFGALGLADTQLATNAILGSLFMAGVGTIIQLLLGARLPIVIGTSFTFVGVFCTIGTSAGGGEIGYYTILGSVLVGGAITAVVCLFVRWWGRLIKPIVPCVVVFGIGLSLLQSGATQFLGGDAFQNTAASPHYLWNIAAAVITLAAAVAWQIFAKGAWKSLNIVFGIVVGYLFCLCVPNMVNFAALKVENVQDVVTYPHFADVGKLRFEALPIALTTAFFLIAVVEGIGDVNALCTDALGRNPTNREIGGVLFFDGLNSALCAFFGTMPLTTFAQNVGIVSQTKVVNRFTVFVGACFLVLLSFFPVAANLLQTIPQCVLGGAMVILFGSIAVVGMQMCAKAGFTQKNVLILSLSVCLGYGITLVDGFFAFLQNAGLHYLADVLSNNVLNMFAIAFVLSWILPENMDFARRKKAQQRAVSTDTSEGADTDGANTKDADTEN